MLVRFLQNIPFNGDFFPKGAIVDMDKVFATKYIGDGLASLVTSDPGMYDPAAIVTTGPATLSGGAVTISPANANVSISPSGSGVVTINPATAGSIDRMVIGGATRNTGAFNTLALTSGDSSGTPGNATLNSGAGRAAIAAAASAVTITNNLVLAADHVIVVPRQLDATLTQWSVVAAAGSFTVTGNAAATANWLFDFVVIRA